MGCQRDSVCKLCRRENSKLFLKGDRCYTDKCAFERRPYPPGQHGQSRLKFSEFALQLREKQKAKRFYGLSERQFRRYISYAESSKEVTGAALLKLLESRLDNVVYTMGFGSSRREARQLISHRHILVNGKCLDVASYVVQKGDAIEVRERSRQDTRILSAVQSVSKRTIPAWLEVDHAQGKGVVKDIVNRDEVSLPIEDAMIIGYYSR